MKKYLSLILCLAMAAPAFFSCKKAANPYEGEATPTLSISSEGSSFVGGQAGLVLELSHFIHKNVEVFFNVEGVEAESLDLPASVIVQAGSVKKRLPVTVDEDFTTPGNKTVKISVSQVNNANLVSGQQPISLGLEVKDEAVVNVSATPFSEEGVATLTFTLSKKVTKDVVLGLEALEESVDAAETLPASRLSFEPSVTIPAGSKTASVKVTADIEGLSPGTYASVIGIASYSANCKAGESVVGISRIAVAFEPVYDKDGNYFILNAGYWYVYRCSSYSYVLWVEPADDGSLDDAEYVKAAMNRCAAYFGVAANRAAYLGYYSGMSGYDGYVPVSIPQVTADKIGYLGWPIGIVNGAMDDNVSGSHNCFMVGFTENLQLAPEYYAAVISL